MIIIIHERNEGELGQEHDHDKNGQKPRALHQAKD